MSLDFESPGVEEFPGLYKTEAVLDDDDGAEKKTKKKDKKDKDKGYATLAAESSPDEDEHADQKSPGKAMKKAFTKLSQITGKEKDKNKYSTKEIASKKDSKKLDKDKDLKKVEKEKDSKKVEKDKDSKKVDKDRDSKKVEKDKDSKKTEKEKDSKKEKEKIKAEKEKNKQEKSSKISGLNKRKSSTPTAVLKKNPEEQEGKLSNALGLKKDAKEKAGKNHRSSVPLVFALSTSNAQCSNVGQEDAPLKSFAFNAFLNAPAPLSSKKSKEKDGHHDVKSKMKLKLKRSKNSQDDSQLNELDRPVSVMLPETAESISKEIKKYEHLLEHAHSQMKASKKVSKKNEEQLWELQKTLTQLKRKLRSVNALSSTMAEKCGSSQGSPAVLRKKDAEQLNVHTPDPVKAIASPLPRPPSIVSNDSGKHGASDKEDGNIEKKSKSSNHQDDHNVDEIELDFTLQTISRPPGSDESTKTKLSVSLSQSQAEEKKYKVSNKFESDFEKPSPFFKSENVEELEGVSEVGESHPKPFSDERLEEAYYDEFGATFSAAGIPPPYEFKDDDDKIPIKECPDHSGSNPAYTNDSSRASSVHGRVEEDECEENMESVLKDTNKMIGSMHEEIEAAEALVRKHQQQVEQRNSPVTHVRATEGIPDPFYSLGFQTEEFISLENEALKQFNEKIRQELEKEEMIYAELYVKLKETQTEPEQGQIEDLEVEDLIQVWKELQAENVYLKKTVDSLSKMVAQSRLEEFLLETRLHYLESRYGPESPTTTITPLHHELET